MELRVDSIGEKKMVGRRMKMSLVHNKTAELWRSFMQSRKGITNAVGTDLYSLQVFDASYFSSFSPAREFEKWALAEVADFDQVPAGMETFTLPAGMYAVFLHKGPASSGPQVFSYIYSIWLPNSPYLLDHRPQFEILGEKYRNDSPDSEEEIWIPVRPKG